MCTKNEANRMRIRQMRAWTIIGAQRAKRACQRSNKMNGTGCVHCKVACVIIARHGKFQKDWLGRFGRSIARWKALKKLQGYKFLLFSTAVEKF